MKSRSSVSLLVGAAGLAAGLLNTSHARGQTLNWSNAAGGSAAVASNWNPNQIPTNVNDLVWNLANTYSVSFGATTTASRTHTYRRGVVTVTASNPHTASAGLTVGDLNGDVATMIFTGGTLTSTDAAVVGSAAGSTGTLNINDDDADLVVAGPGNNLIIGNNGAGTLNITGGGLASVAGRFVAGSNAAAVSNVTVSGQLSVNPFTRSTLDVNSTTDSRLGQGGDATVTISNGALASFAGDVVVANGAASASTVTVAGVGLSARATLDVAGDLMLGRNITAGSAAGTATLNVNGDGRVLVGGTLFVAGDPDGGTAVFHTSQGGGIVAQSLSFGPGTTLDLDGGTIDVEGGTLQWLVGTPIDLNGGVNNPILTLRNNTTASLPTSAGAALRVGNGAGINFADFDVRSGSDLITNGGQIQLGVGSDDNGSMVVEGNGSTLTMLGTGRILSVGIAGTGRFEAEIGGNVSGDVLQIATGGSSTGFCLFENPGTTATFNQIAVGGTTGVQGGNGDLIVNASATLSMPVAGILRIWPTGFMEVAQSAVVDAPLAGVMVGANLELENGALMRTSQTTVLSGGLIEGPVDIAGSSTLESRVTIQSGGALTLVNGNLTVGNAAAADGFKAEDGSVVTVGTHTLTLHDLDRAIVDVVTIAGGQIVAPNGLEVFTPGTTGTLDGFGTITTPELFIQSGGSVITATGASGLTINGKFRNNSGMIDGTKYTFNVHPGTGEGGWTGAGTINARVVFNSGTEMNALANMTVGAAATDGVTFNSGSKLHADTRVVTLVDSNGVLLPTMTDFNGGTVTCAQAMSLASGRSIQGSGTTAGTLNVGAGKLQPGFPGSDRTHTLFFDGTLNLSTPSEFTCEIAGLIDNDGLFVNGTANLSGTVRVELINGHVPQLGNSYFIMQIDGAMNGEFTSLIAPRGFHIVYGFSDSHVISLFYCPPDFDEDGFLTGLDFDLFVQAFENGDMAADYDEDGFLTGIDFDVFVQDFEHGCG